jgi:hypothetical protein
MTQALYAHMNKKKKKKKDPISKISNTKKGWWSGSSGKSLPSKCEALRLNPHQVKKKGINKKQKTNGKMANHINNILDIN